MQQRTERCATCGAYPEDFHEDDCPAAVRPEDGEIVEGARLMVSPLTDALYIVTKWKDLGGGKYISLEKREIETCGIRECTRCGDTGSPDEEYGVEGVPRIAGNVCIPCTSRCTRRRRNHDR